MSAQSTVTWVRLSGQWVRADRIVAVRLELPASAGLPGRWGSTVGVAGLRLMVCAELPVEDDGEKRALWRQAGVCAEDRAEVVEANLLDAIASQTAGAGAPRYVFPVERDGWLVHWEASTTRPQRSKEARSVLHLAPERQRGLR
ncbi:hypothetical protein [Streptomyces halobius]|uniref:Uncharacterized protein n=1 Tax=Streptomyces halobius TaxID=2879846 RepID=A0ABY4M1Q6_9ACTN|nr:hypothetical protein [Streptomyces halobius]UQA91367.1 hypothetical protein K9S39_05275 [Streptomyces halobius]